MHEIRWGAFITALILAPLTLAIPALVILMVLVPMSVGNNPIGIVAMATFVAAFAGAPTYLTLGAACFWYVLRRSGPDTPFFWSMALAANLVSTPLVLIFFLLIDAREALGSTAFLIGFGCIYAPLWGLIFGWIYRWFTHIGDRLQNKASARRQRQIRN